MELPLGTLIAVCSGRAGGTLASYMLTQNFIRKWNIPLGKLIAICSGRTGGTLASYMLTQEP